MASLFGRRLALRIGVDVAEGENFTFTGITGEALDAASPVSTILAVKRNYNSSGFVFRDCPIQSGNSVIVRFYAIGETL